MSWSRNLRRMSHIGWASVRHGFAFAVGDPIANRWRDEPVDRPTRLRRYIEALGGSFVKFGQMLALQPDILPLRYCDALFDLMDRMAPFPFAEARRIIIEELGQPPEALFDRFDVEEIATASIGQVYRARFQGREAAVKVQRPDTEVEVARDIRIMAAFVRMIELFRIRPLHWMIEPMSEFVSWTREELDYRNEARYMHRIRENAKGNTVEKAPEVFWERTTRRVLTVEFLDGVTVLDYLRMLNRGDRAGAQRLAAMGFDRERFARNIIDNFLGDAFNHGLFHADLHPANLMILADNQVGYIDFGITGVLSRYSRNFLVTLTLAYTRADLDKMLEIFLKVSAYGPKSDIEGFRAGLKRHAAGWYERAGGRVSLRTNITRVMLDMLTLSRAANIWPERDVIKYIRSTIAIDGLVTRFAPGFEAGAYLARISARYLKWGERQRAFAYDQWFESLLASGRLMTQGPELAVARARRALASRERPESAAAGRRARPSRRAPWLAFAAASLTGLVVFTGQAPVLGVNLFTAELLTLGAALSLFFKTAIERAA